MVSTLLTPLVDLSDDKNYNYYYKPRQTPLGTFPVPLHVGQTSDPALKSKALLLRVNGFSLLIVCGNECIDLSMMSHVTRNILRVLHSYN